METPEKALDKAVVGLFTKKNAVFLSTIYCGLKKIWTDVDNPTAYVQGTKMGINPDWFLSLTKESRISLIAHEIFHIALRHAERTGSREPKRWNNACDHANNLGMLDHGFVFDMPGCYDPKYKGMSAEQIYDLLPEAPALNVFGYDLRPQENSIEEQAEIVSLISRAHMAQTLNDGAGHLPGDITTYVESLLKPRISWDAQLRRWLTHVSEESYTWARPNRRFEDVYLPSRGCNEGLEHLAWAVDSSGSMTDRHLQIINSELAGAKEKFNPDRMTILVFDTVVNTILEYSRDTPIKPMGFKGRWGTDMNDLFNWCQKNKPTALIVFSDMDCCIPPQIPGLKVLWVCFDNPDWIPPYGDVIHVNSMV